jgi:hypothetical protein
MRRRATIASLAAAAALTAASLASALPQQQGSVDLLNQYDGQWQGPGEAQGGSDTGWSLAGLPDVFHDGRGAIAIGAPTANPGGRLSAGSVYVVAPQRNRATTDLTALTGRGYRIDGADPGDQLGFALTALTLPGGHPGLAIGAPYATAHGRATAGQVYVIDLRRLHGNLDLSSPRRSRAVVGVITGPVACAEAGYALAGVPATRPRRGGPLLIGAPGDDASCQGGNRGAAFLISAARVASRLDLARGGRAASVFAGGASGDRAGAAVAGVGPGAFLIGAPQASPLNRTGAGAAYLLHGSHPGRVTSLGAPPGGSTTFIGAAPDDDLGFSLAGTANRLLLGAPQGSPYGRVHAGSVFAVPASHQPARVDLSSIAKPHGARGLRIDGVSAGDEAGWAVTGTGDLNGDGKPDLAIGAPFVNSQTGQDRIDNGAAYVVYGAQGQGILELSALHSRGYVALGARNSDEAGSAVAGVTNGGGDGRPDLLIGAPYAQNTAGPVPAVGGSVYMLFGFGRPAVHYPRASAADKLGVRSTPLVPVAHSTGRPRFSISPALPRGLAIDHATGRIHGTPRVRSLRTVYTVQMEDLSGVGEAAVSLSVSG